MTPLYYFRNISLGKGDWLNSTLEQNELDEYMMNTWPYQDCDAPSNMEFKIGEEILVIKEGDTMKKIRVFIYDTNMNLIRMKKLSRI
jgi:hypothetical protein